MKEKNVSKSKSGKAKVSEWLTSRINKAKGQRQKTRQGLIGAVNAVLRSLAIPCGGSKGRGSCGF